MLNGVSSTGTYHQHEPVSSLGASQGSCQEVQQEPVPVPGESGGIGQEPAQSVFSILASKIKRTVNRALGWEAVEIVRASRTERTPAQTFEKPELEEPKDSSAEFFKKQISDVQKKVNPESQIEFPETLENWGDLEKFMLKLTIAFTETNQRANLLYLKEAGKRDEIGKHFYKLYLNYVEQRDERRCDERKFAKLTNGSTAVAGTLAVAAVVSAVFTGGSSLAALFGAGTAASAIMGGGNGLLQGWFRFQGDRHQGNAHEAQTYRSLQSNAMSDALTSQGQLQQSLQHMTDNMKSILDAMSRTSQRISRS